jgi:hypothetical protein
MVRHLLKNQAKTRLSLGKSIAQFEPDYTILRWITVYKGDDKAYAVACHEVFDEGNEDELDIREFSHVDSENLPYRVIHQFDSVEEALVFAATTYDASAQSYVIESMLDEEYSSYLRARNGTSG